MYNSAVMARALTVVIVGLGLIGCGQSAPPVIDPGVQADTGPAGNVCAPGSQQCNGNDLVICLTDGTGYSTLECKLACADGKCMSSSCPPSSQRCAGPRLAEACDAQGKSQLTVCDHGCLNGECALVVCSPGHTFCEPDGSKVQRCALDGLTIDELESCPHGCDPATATCRAPACAAGKLICGPTEPNRVYKCNPDRTGFEPTDIVCAETCVSGHCHVSACLAGEQRCGGEGVEQCNPSGSEFVVVETCKWGCLSNEAGEAFCASCLPGAYACIGKEVVFCEAPYLPWQLVKTCKEIDTCAGGSCVPVLTLVGSPSDTDVLILLIEAMSDCWITMKDAEEKEDVCRGIVTTGLEGHIAQDDIGSWFCENEGESITAEDFSDIAHFDAAKDLLGCGWFAIADLTVNTPGELIHAGLSYVECLAHEKDEIIIAPCETLEDK